MVFHIYSLVILVVGSCIRFLCFMVVVISRSNNVWICKGMYDEATEKCKWIGCIDYSIIVTSMWLLKSSLSPIMHKFHWRFIFNTDLIHSRCWCCWCRFCYCFIYSFIYFFIVFILVCYLWKHRCNQIISHVYIRKIITEKILTRKRFRFSELMFFFGFFLGYPSSLLNENGFHFVFGRYAPI